MGTVVAKLDMYSLEKLIALGGTSAVFAAYRRNDCLKNPWQVAIKFVWRTELARIEADQLIELGNIKGVVNLIDYFESTTAEVMSALESKDPMFKTIRDTLEKERLETHQQMPVGVLVLQFLAGEPLVTKTEAVEPDWSPQDPKRVWLVQDLETQAWYRQELVRNFDLLTRIKILKAISSYVGACHARGIVHGDLKPQNMLFHPENDQVTMLDFGGGTALTRGSPGWQAPEHLKLALGDLEKAPKGLDIFLLGLFLNRFLQPFHLSKIKTLTERCLGPLAHRPTAAEIENALSALERRLNRNGFERFGFPVGILILLIWVYQAFFAS